MGGAVVAGRSRSGSSSSSADERIMSPASTISDAEAGDLSDSGGTEDSIPQKSQHNVRKYESPPTPVTSAASAASINMEGPGMKRRKLNRPDAEAMLQEKKRRQTQALIQQGHNQQLMANQHQQQQNHEFLNNQLRVHLLQLQQQRRVKQLVSQGSCFVQDKKTKRKRKCDEPLSSLACMSYPMLSSMLAPAQSVQFSPTGLMTGMVPSQVTGAAQGQVTSNNCSKGVVNLSSMLENCVAKSAKQQATMEQQYAMALNNMNAVISMGGNQVKKAETRRREKRRLSAQRRRERKRCTLSYMEEKVCNAKKEDAKLSELLSKHLEQDVDDTTKESRAAIQKVLDGANKAIMEPLFPFWKDILEKARKETMQDDAPQLSDESAMKKALSKDPSEEDKLKIRRERNRISARMSRLRKRLRQNYLEETLDLLSKRIALVKSALHAGGVQVNLSSSE